MSKEEIKCNREMLMLRTNKDPRTEASLSQSEPKKLLIAGIKPNLPDLNEEPCSDSEGEDGEIIATSQNLVSLKAQDADHIGLNLSYDLEVEIFTRLSCFNYWKLNFLNKQLRQFVKSGDFFKVRRERGFMEPYLFMLSGDNTCWKMFDKDFKNFRKLPKILSDYCFSYGDKETISVGTQLIVVGRDIKGVVVWRFELEMNKWIKGPEMITPRVMYGSASCGTHAFIAGGIKTNESRIPEVISVAEKYNANTKTWTMINGMHKRRKYSSGCFLHDKFYVIGGRDENDEYLTCGECYDEVTDSWKLIPHMLGNMSFMFPQSPPFIAVVNDNLYYLEIFLNEIRVYDFNANAWKKLGRVPVRGDVALGWGIAFKSVEDKLLVIGAPSSQNWYNTMSVYSCCPSPDVEELIWEESTYCCDGVQINQFIRNCCVMFA